MPDLTTAHLTAEDLPYVMPDEELCELVAGSLIREPLPGETHGVVAGRVFGHLFRFVEERRLGRLYAAETGFVLARDPDTVRGPDAAFVSRRRSDATVRRGPFFEGAPDLAVEVLSPRQHEGRDRGQGPRVPGRRRRRRVGDRPAARDGHRAPPWSRTADHHPRRPHRGRHDPAGLPFDGGCALRLTRRTKTSSLG